MTQARMLAIVLLVLCTIFHCHGSPRLAVITPTMPSLRQQQSLLAIKVALENSSILMTEIVVTADVLSNYNVIESFLASADAPNTTAAFLVDGIVAQEFIVAQFQVCFYYFIMPCGAPQIHLSPHFSFLWLLP